MQKSLDISKVHEDRIWKEMPDKSSERSDTATVLGDGLYFKRFSTIYQITSRMTLVRVPVTITLVQGVFRVYDGVPVRRTLQTRPVFRKKPRRDDEETDTLF